MRMWCWLMGVLAAAAILAAVTVGNCLVAARASAQGQAAEGQQATDGQMQPGTDDPAFDARLWRWLDKVEYRLWAPWPGQDGGFYPGQSPHGAFLKMYVSRPVFNNLQDPPHGSIIIKENYNDEKKLLSITIMERVTAGFDPENNDWYWIKYQPDGTVAAKDGMRLGGAVKGCIDCHNTAAGGDYIFTNDKEEDQGD